MAEVNRLYFKQTLLYYEILCNDSDITESVDDSRCLIFGCSVFRKNHLAKVKLR